VAIALDLVLTLFLIEPDLRCSHDLTSTLATGVKFHLEETEWIVGRASVAIELNEGHVPSGDDSDDRVGALLSFTRHGDLITSGGYRVYAALVFLFQCAAKGIAALLLD